MRRILAVIVLLFLLTTAFYYIYNIDSNTTERIDDGPGGDNEGGATMVDDF